MRTILLSLLFIFSVAILFSCAGQQSSTSEVKQLTPTEYKAQKMSNKAVLVDVRTPEEYAEGHLDGSINSDYRGGEFEKEMKNWNKDKVYYLYCASGNRSGKAAELLKEAGFKHIYNIGGYPSLKEAGLPISQ